MANQEFAKAAELKQQITELEEQKEVLDAAENSFSQTVRSEEKVCKSQVLILDVDRQCPTLCLRCMVAL